MSSTLLKCIVLIISYIRFGGLLDYVHFSIKPSFCPLSDSVQQMSFLRALDLQ